MATTPSTPSGPWTGLQGILGGPATGVATTPTATPAPSGIAQVAMPNMPIMGGLTSDGRSGQVAYTGGTPKSDNWLDGLDEESKNKPVEITHRRPQDGRGGNDKEKDLLKGLEVKYSKAEGFDSFSKRFFVMTKQKGQDTVMYIFKDSKLFSVLLIPHIVTQEQVDLLMTQRGVLDYDVYDHQNDRTLKAAL